MGVDAAWPLQVAVLERLRGDEDLEILLGDSPQIIDTPANNNEEPRVEFGDSVSRAWQSATFDGQEHEISLNLWTGEGGSCRSKETASRIIDLLHNADLALAGHALVDFQFEASETRYRLDRNLHHCRLTFKALTVSD